MRKRAAFRCIGVDEAESLIRRDNVLVLDVRDAAAFARAHITGAHNISIDGLSAVIDGTARSTPLVIYCHHGYASQEYAQVFSDFGFSEVYSLEGGYEAWSDAARGMRPAAPDKALQQWLATHGFPAEDVNATVANGVTPLMKAARGGHIAIMGPLITAGARLDARNADGNNALWFACLGSHLDVIALLVEAGIDIDNRNDNSATPLMYAASAGKAAIVERLLALGADAAPETLDGFTALDLAATVECLALLRRRSHTSSRRQSAGPPLTARQSIREFR